MYVRMSRFRGRIQNVRKKTQAFAACVINPPAGVYPGPHPTGETQMKPKLRLKKPNLAARELADPKYQKRVVKALKGKGSYRRKGRQAHPGALLLYPARVQVALSPA